MITESGENAKTLPSPEEVEKYAAKVLQETKETRRKGIEEVQKWATENPKLHIRTDEKYIVPFLRLCKYDLKKTKEKITNFYCMKRDRNEWFRNRDANDPDIQSVVNMGSIMVLKEFDENRLVVIVRVPGPEISTDLVMKVGQMVLDIALVEEEFSQIYGVTVIIDLTKASLSHISQFTPSKVKNVFQLWQNGQYRPQRIYFVNVPLYIRAFLGLIMSFMSGKLKKRVKICQDCDLSQIMDKNILPQEYGGCGETVQDSNKFLLDKLISYNSWFAEDEKKFIPE